MIRFEVQLTGIPCKGVAINAAVLSGTGQQLATDAEDELATILGPKINAAVEDARREFVAEQKTKIITPPAQAVRDIPRARRNGQNKGG